MSASHPRYAEQQGRGFTAGDSFFRSGTASPTCRGLAGSSGRQTTPGGGSGSESAGFSDSTRAIGHHCDDSLHLPDLIAYVQLVESGQIGSRPVGSAPRSREHRGARGHRFQHPPYPQDDHRRPRCAVPLPVGRQRRCREGIRDPPVQRLHLGRDRRRRLQLQRAPPGERAAYDRPLTWNSANCAKRQRKVQVDSARPPYIRRVSYREESA
jgi:hypothetical protein